jgi:RHS repeat-associated protein
LALSRTFPEEESRIMSQIRTIFSAGARALGLLLGLAVAYPVAAQQHTNQARGFNGDAVYQLGDIDHVNLFNGNLTIDIPIGQEYTTNDGFSYRLRLVYNSNLWTFREVCSNIVNFSYDNFYSSWFIVDENFTRYGRWDLIPSGSWWDRYEQPRFQSETNFCLTAALPNPASNAGFGWQVTLGELYAPRAGAWSELSPRLNESGRFMYVSPDGSEHLFFDALHVEEAAAPDAPPVPDPEWSYTRDGSYLRMRKVAAGYRTIEFPNGEVHHFVEETTNHWQLVEISDPYDNYLRINYSTPNVWQLSDSAGRSHEVRFASPGGGAPPVVSEIKLAKFGGGTASYQFVHSPLHLERGCPSHPELATGTHVDVARLDQVILPDGQRYRMIDYDETGAAASCSLNGVLLELEQPTGARIAWSYENPAGSGVGTFFDPERRWINGYVYPQGSSPRAYVRGSDGIHQRTITDPVTGQVDTWLYEPHLFCEEENVTTLGGCFDFGVGQGPPPEAPKRFVTIVTPPDGTRRVHYFSVKSVIDVTEDPDPEAWDPAEYGLPINRSIREETPGRPPLFLSWEVFPAGVDPFPEPAVAGDPPPPRPTPMRAGYVHYELDSPTYNSTDPSSFYSIPDSGFGELTLLNRREAATRTVYYDPSGARIGHRDVWRSDFDGLGHYRREEIAGQIAAVGNTPKTVVTRYNPETGSYPGSFSLPASNQPWLLNDFDKIVRSQPGSSTFETRYCFDSETGFLHGSRALKNSGAGETPKDRLTRYVRSVDSTGTDGVVRLSELHYGGDDPDTTPAGCGGAIPGPAEYRIDRSFRWGTLEMEVWVNDYNGEIESTPENNTRQINGVAQPGIDPHTGIVAATTGSDGLVTLFEFDSLGRRTRTIPQNGLSATTVHEYGVHLNSQGNPRGARTTTCKLPALSSGNCSSSSVLEIGTIDFDGSGRPLEERRRHPGTCADGYCWSKQRFDRFFAPNERHEHVGSWEPAENAANQTHWTKSIYDAFDQLTRVREPRGGIWETVYEHSGTGTVRQANWTFTHVPGHADGGELTQVSKWTVRDLAGRMVKVTEKSDEASALAAITRYEHDADDHLTKVLLYAAAPNGEAGELKQSREFSYDGRGFMTRERLPELGESGNGEIFYTFDSLGRVLTKTHGSATPGPGPFNLRYSYDRAGRLIRIEGYADGTNLTAIEERFYARLNDVPGRHGLFSADKLVQSKRFNPTADVRVTETYTYNSPDGGLSAKVTRSSSSLGALGFRQSFTYDSLGHLTSQNYPEVICATGSCSGSPPARTVTQQYQDGMLVKVSSTVGGQALDVASKITYHPNGLTAEVTHKNLGATPGTFVTTWERLTNDPHGLQRPASIEHIAAGGAGWTTGAIGYDTIGNVFQIGADRFAYDGAHRLQWARQTIEEGCTSAPCVFEYEYDYDIPGNLTAMRAKEDGVAVSRPFITASAANNRLVGAGNVYDTAGNITLWDNRMAFTYDPLNRVAAQGAQESPKQMIYDADGERLVVKDFQLDSQGRVLIWRLRGVDNQVLREVQRNADGSWSWKRDYLFRDQRLLAQITPASGTEALSHLYLDHLGTPRHTSGPAGFLGSYREYGPYGEELSKPRHEQDFLQFTGHERDFNCLTNGGCSAGSFQAKVDDLDYMHARYYSPWQGRFLSVDPEPGALDSPQSWNRYTYARSNPLRYVDPDGEAILNLTAGAVGAAVGGVTGFLGSVISQSLSGKEINYRDAAAAALGGAVSGGLAGLTLGGSLLAEAGVGTVVAVNATANAIGGAVTRATDSPSANTDVADPGEIAFDVAVGAAGGYIGYKVNESMSSSVPELQRTAEGSREASRHGGGYGASRAAAGTEQKIKEVKATADAVATVVGAKTTNVVAPAVRQEATEALDKRKDDP